MCRLKLNVLRLTPGLRRYEHRVPTIAAKQKQFNVTQMEQLQLIKTGVRISEACSR